MSLAVRAAVELGVLESLVPGPRSMPDLTAETGTDPAAVTRLVRVMVDLGLVEPAAGDNLALAERGRLLRSQEPARLDTLVLMRTVLPNLAAWQRLGEAVREGRSVFEEDKGRNLWSWLAADLVQGAKFNAAMARRGPAQSMAILDCHRP